MHAHWITRVSVAGALLSLSACGIAGPEEVSEGESEHGVRERDPRTPSDSDGRPEDARPPEAIVAGSEATSYPSAAIVNMKQGSFQTSVCSGSVVAPRLVLTAGHCAVGNYDNWDVYAPYAGGQVANSTQALVYDYTDTGGLVNPNQHDVALLVLDRDIQLSTYPELATAASAAGTQVRNIGRVDNGTMHYTRLFVGPAQTLQNGSGWGYPYSYVSSEIIQSGDSGGPVLLDGVFPHRIVAVNSGAGGGIQILARVDQINAWINTQIQTYGGAAQPPPDDPGQACEHDKCTEGGKLVSSCDPCVQQICAQDAYCCSTAWDGVCVSEVQSICSLSCTAPEPPPEPDPPPPPPEPEDPCGGITYAGQCVGAVLSWCENEAVSTVDCAQSGRQCSWDAGNSFFNCL